MIILLIYYNFSVFHELFHDILPPSVNADQFEWFLWRAFFYPKCGSGKSCGRMAIGAFLSGRLWQPEERFPIFDWSIDCLNKIETGRVQLPGLLVISG